jgi:S1-C subfamily serine protease
MSIQFFRPGYLEIDPQYCVPNNPGSTGAAVVTAKKNGIAYGAKITQIYAGSPLPDVGIEVGDVVIEMDGIPVKTSKDISERLRYYPDGVWVDLKIERGTARFQLVPRSRIDLSKKSKPITISQ